VSQRGPNDTCGYQIKVVLIFVLQEYNFSCMFACDYRRLQVAEISVLGSDYNDF
jgi:hypothetical protein